MKETNWKKSVSLFCRAVRLVVVLLVFYFLLLLTGVSTHICHGLSSWIMGPEMSFAGIQKSYICFNCFCNDIILTTRKEGYTGKSAS